MTKIKEQELVIIDFSKPKELGFLLGCLAFHFEEKTESSNSNTQYVYLGIAFDELEHLAGIIIDREKTISFFQENGGYDDIEILINVLTKFQEKHL